MDQKWVRITAGILDIIGAVLYGSGSLGFFIYLFTRPQVPGHDGAVETIFAAVALLGIPVVILAVVGGVHTLKRKKWGWSLAASFALFFHSIVVWGLFALITGVLEWWLLMLVSISDIILTVLSKKQFR